MKNIRAVVKVTISRPKRRPIVVLSVARCELASSLPVHPDRTGRRRAFLSPRDGRLDQCNLAALTDNCFRAVLCAGIRLPPDQMPLQRLTCQ